MLSQRSRPVLVVDDDEGVLEVLVELLGAEGMEVRTAANGLDGLREMRRDPTPAAVLLDLHMPVMDGFQFRAEQLGDPALRAIPVILYSGHHDVADAAARMGIEGYLQKPIDIQRILVLLNRYQAGC
jgi:CheY-like chemotaxis protein